MRERLKPESLRESLMKVSILDVLSLGVRGGVPEGDGDHGDNIRLKANMI